MKKLGSAPPPLPIAAVALLASGIALLAPGIAFARATGPHRAEFAVPSLGIYYCSLDAQRTSASVSCEGASKHLYQRRATLDGDGDVTLCQERGVDNHCDLGNPGIGHIPTLGYGRLLDVGPFRCELSHAGLKCTVRASGKGFLMSATKLAAVGSADVTTPPLQLEAFLSPDRKVWCSISQTQAFCATGGNQQPGGRQSLATVTKAGHVTICVSPEVTVMGTECIQNWDDELPQLRQGQTTEIDGFRCTSDSDDITCTAVGSGKGFRVSATEAVEVGPGVMPDLSTS